MVETITQAEIAELDAFEGQQTRIAELKQKRLEAIEAQKQADAVKQREADIQRVKAEFERVYSNVLMLFWQDIPSYMNDIALMAKASSERFDGLLAKESELMGQLEKLKSDAKNLDIRNDIVGIANNIQRETKAVSFDPETELFYSSYGNVGNFQGGLRFIWGRWAFRKKTGEFCLKDDFLN